MNVVLVDIETRSPVDLPKEGGRRYSQHPATEVLTVCWYDTETGGQGTWIPRLPVGGVEKYKGLIREHIPEGDVHTGPMFPRELEELVKSGKSFVAHNAWGFDAVVWAKKFPEYIPANWIDTDPLARACGLPGGLDKIGKEIRDGKGKHKEGKSRLKKFMGMKQEPKVGDLILIAAYCWDDTCGLLKTLWDYLQARPLNKFEEVVLAAHKDINATGVRLDLDLAYAMEDLAAHAQNEALLKCQELSGGADSPFKSEGDLRKRDLVMAWILQKTASIPTGLLVKSRNEDGTVEVKYTLRKEVVEQLIAGTEVSHGEGRDADIEFSGSEADESLEDDLQGGDVRIPRVVVEFLKARFAVLRITRGKIKAAITRVVEGYLKDPLVYYGAHTGRFAGRGLNIANLPRPAQGVPVWELVEIFKKEGKLPPDRVQEVLTNYHAQLLVKDPHAELANLDDAASALLRGLLVPDEGDFFVAADYHAIELRAALVLAEANDHMERFFVRGIDPYCEMAEKIYGRKCINKKDPIRQVGKVVVLGSQYQMGDVKFLAYALSQGVDLEAAGTDAKTCITAFRDMFPGLAGERTGDYTKENQPIRSGGLWRRLEAGAIRGLETGASRVGKIVFRRIGTDLHMIGPSGRPIIYRDAKLAEVVPWWEKGKKNPQTKLAVTYLSPRGFRNVLYGGKILENACQGLISRDILVDAMVRCHAEGLKVRFHVYDELILSCRTPEEGHRAVQIMSTAPTWLPGFPLRVEADTMPRYGKTAPPGWLSFNYENGVLAA